ncbi:XylR family transcriptional regulator [Vibrio sp. S4M6]|nr:XylR family transcriptional regulator [Vibrio sinus]MCL9780007.1 XylR family transcriptional regulator [Vibrio sinus]
MSKIFRILLLFNANKIYDREIIEGVGKYIASTGACWEVYVEDDYLIDRKSIDDWYGDGIIADLDDPDIADALAGSTIPTVGVGSSYEHHKDYPHFPYVATDNRALIESAVDHLTQRGLTSLAFYGANPSPYNRWAKEREKAFLSLTKERGYNSSVFRGFDTNARNWTFCMNRITDWIQQLPKPIGIVAVTDSRARHIIQACANTDIHVPENVAVIGIDNDDVARSLNRISLSSVAQNGNELGFVAAKKLSQMLEKDTNVSDLTKIGPLRVYDRQSSDFHAVNHPLIMTALHFIRVNVGKGIKSYHVFDALNVSRSKLEVLFKSELGTTVHDQIFTIRLKKACQLLKSKNKSIEEIAKLSGYPTTQYMYSVFAKNLSMTPKEYREKEG